MTLAALDKAFQVAAAKLRAYESRTDATEEGWLPLEVEYRKALRAWSEARAAAGPSAREIKAIARQNRGWAD